MKESSIKSSILFALFSLLSISFALNITYNNSIVNDSYPNNSFVNDSLLNDSQFNDTNTIICEENFTLMNNECIKASFSNVSNVEFSVLKELTKEEFVRVFVNFVDSNIDYSVRSNRMNQIDTIQNKIISSLNSEDFILVHSFELTPSFSAYINEKALLELSSNELVKNIEIVRRGHQSLGDSIPFINADLVWELEEPIFGSITGVNQTVCVVDSGVNGSHSDLVGKVVDQKCYCYSSGGSGCCPSGGTEEDNAMDGTGHGTHVAGIIAANGTLKGVAPGVDIIAVRVLDSNGDLWNDDFEKGIEWCYLNTNSTIISTSLNIDDWYTGTCDGVGAEVTEINNAHDENIFVVVSTGNDGNLTGIARPSCASGAFPVGASNESNSIMIESNRNQNTIFAPGQDIYSTRGYLGSCLSGCSCYGDYAMECSGTSQATPHVAGVAALMKQANNSLTPDDIESIMTRTGVLIYDPDTGSTFPHVDAYRSVMASIYDVFVSDTEVLSDNRNNKVFNFNIFNNLDHTSGVSFNLSLGDGNYVTNNQGISLGAYDDLWVYIDHNYTMSGVYTVNVTANDTNWQAITTTVDKDIDMTNATVLCTDCNDKRVFSYILQSYYGNQTVDWSIDFGDGTNASSNFSVNLTLNDTVWLFIEHEYDSIQEYTVTGTLNNSYMTEYADELTVNITQLG